MITAILILAPIAMAGAGVGANIHQRIQSDRRSNQLTEVTNAVRKKLEDILKDKNIKPAAYPKDRPLDVESMFLVYQNELRKHLIQTHQESISIQRIFREAVGEYTYTDNKVRDADYSAIKSMWATQKVRAERSIDFWMDQKEFPPEDLVRLFLELI